MKRRDFIKILGAGALINPITSIFASPARKLDYDKWNGFRLSYHVTLPNTGKKARLWLPLPDSTDTKYQITLGNIWDGTNQIGQFNKLKNSNSPVFYAEWNQPGERHLTVSSIVKTSHHFTDLNRATNESKYTPSTIKPFLNATRLLPLDGIVRQTAINITSEHGATSSIEKARAIYNWVITNTDHDSNLSGRGSGDIKFILENKLMSGKCVDINSLFVGLCRASGIPARIQYGIRLNESELHPSLSRLNDVTQSQHSRSEFYVNHIGWIPVNPADVNKVIKLENLAHDHPSINNLQKKFFGTWEMNWASFNYLNDVELTPTSAVRKLPYFMFPHAEIDGQALDSLDPVNFSYKITSSLLIGTGATF